jgi:hypothetical protein
MQREGALTATQRTTPKLPSSPLVVLPRLTCVVVRCLGSPAVAVDASWPMQLFRGLVMTAFAGTLSIPEERFALASAHDDPHNSPPQFVTVTLTIANASLAPDVWRTQSSWSPRFIAYVTAARFTRLFTASMRRVLTMYYLQVVTASW